MAKRKRTYLTECPHLIAEWYPEKNDGLDPAKITHGSEKKVWWVCPLEHTWEATVNNRTLHGTGCPICSGRKVLPGFNDLGTTHPELVAEWSGRNAFDPQTVSAGSGRRVIWECTAEHTWEAKVNSRAGLCRGCPICSGQKVLPGFNDLATTHSELVAEWSGRNTFGPESVSAGSNKRVWWVCPLEHTWEVKVKSRAGLGAGCPYCSGRRPILGETDLITTHPELAAEWSVTNAFGPDNVSAGSNKRVWWECVAEHTWEAEVKSRAGLGTGCPKCCLNQTSKIEGELYRLLSERFPDAKQGVRVGRWSVDVALVEEKVAVEYDGAYFHKEPLDRDSRKTVDLLGRGYRVIRIRERSRQYTLPSLDIEDPRYLELIYEYSADWHGLDATVNKITEWLLPND